MLGFDGPLSSQHLPSEKRIETCQKPQGFLFALVLVLEIEHGPCTTMNIFKNMEHPLVFL